MKYRKKPVVIEALQWEGFNLASMWAFLEPIEGRVTQRGENFQIPTLEGVMEASPGDWIIRGVEGEFYPCKDSIFRATYEAVS